MSNPVVNQTSVQNSSVSATDLVPDHQGITIRDVKNRAVLDICLLPDSNLVDIASDYGLIPNT
jgi:hypothetical protein